MRTGFIHANALPSSFAMAARVGAWLPQRVHRPGVFTHPLHPVICISVSGRDLLLEDLIFIDQADKESVVIYQLNPLVPFSPSPPLPLSIPTFLTFLPSHPLPFLLVRGFSVPFTPD